MTKFTAFALMLALIVFVLCGCLPQPFTEQIITSNNSAATDNETDNNAPSLPTRKIYVSGAVQIDGYITVPVACDYKTVLQLCGVTDYTAILANINAAFNQYTDVCIVDFTFNGSVCSSVNVNGIFVVGRFDVDGVSSDVIDKLAIYIENYGTITNRNHLKSALGDDYKDNYYKFYIDESDYA